MNLFGTVPIEAIGKTLDSLFTSDDERLGRKEALERLALQPALEQIEINKIEAASKSVWVAGWRPFIGWVCGVGLLFAFVGNPVIQWVTGEPGPALPLQSIDALVTSMLGFGALRTFEKIKNRA